METTILIVEDDRRLAAGLADGLTEAGFRVQHASTGAEARSCVRDHCPALILLDLGLPDEDGLAVLEAIRTDHPTLPVIITTARETIAQRVDGLESGADDYLVKPYAFEELRARIRAQLRHLQHVQPQRQVGDLLIDLVARTAVRGHTTLDLTPREFDLLAYLASLRGETASRDMIQREVWKVRSRMTSMDNVIDVHVSRLRQKLAETEGPPLLHTIRGVGFVLKDSL